MNVNVKRIKKRIRRIEAVLLAGIVFATSLSFSVSAMENSEQELIVEQEEESERKEGTEQEELVPAENTKTENNELEENETEGVSDQENEGEEDSPFLRVLAEEVPPPGFPEFVARTRHRRCRFL